jgi:hypothetical protein
MKKIIFLFFILFLSLSSFAQKDIPELVKQTFQTMYADAEDSFWDFREGAYVANFQSRTGLTKVFIDPSGNWVETRIRKSLSSLPVKVESFIEQHYKTADITFAGKIIRENEVLYRVESELPDAVVIKLLTKEGVLVKEDRIDFGNVLPSSPGLEPLSGKKNEISSIKELY